jgi:hypothetical protein
VIVPAKPAPKAARAFITQSGLDLPGPVTATVTLRAQQTGEITFAWRTRGERDFHPENKTAVAWTADDQPQTIETQLAITGRLIHFRLQPSSTAVFRSPDHPPRPQWQGTIVEFFGRQVKHGRHRCVLVHEALDRVRLVASWFRHHAGELEQVLSLIQAVTRCQDLA